MTVVHIIPYSAEWQDLFQKERANILAVFTTSDVQIEHIGSTAVPGLVAKPVIDIMLGAPSLSVIEEHITSLEQRGYTYVPKYEAEIPLRRYFVKSLFDSLRVHLHGVETGSRIWQEHLTFRDTLRSDETLREEYQALKLRLAQEFSNDKAAYTAAKDPFIKAVLARFLPNIDTPAL